MDSIDRFGDDVRKVKCGEEWAKILYLDLNSCFATIEQQARPCLRGKPVAVTNRLVPNSCIITASYEAKACGVKVGMRRVEAEALCPGLVFTESEPSKYIYVHERLRRIMEEYSTRVEMKSIDEGVIDLTRAPVAIRERSAVEVAEELKARLKSEVGCYMRSNAGVASNRFLAKLAAELHKPDGLDAITPENKRTVFTGLGLTDLPGINVRFERRLKTYRINTPLEFLDASEEVLRRQVFLSIDGTKWYKRLRGIEVDGVTSTIKSVGRQFVLESKTLSREEVWQRMAHLVEDVGYRLRSKGLYARGVYIWGYGYNGVGCKAHELATIPFSADREIMAVARKLFRRLPDGMRVIGVTLYKLQDGPNPQMSLFEEEYARERRVAEAVDSVNRRFGARTLHSALTLGTDSVQAKLPFGSTRYLDHAIA